MNSIERYALGRLEDYVCLAENGVHLAAVRNERVFSESPERIDHLGVPLREAKAALIDLRMLIKALKENDKCSS